VQFGTRRVVEAEPPPVLRRIGAKIDPTRGLAPDAPQSSGDHDRSRLRCRAPTELEARHPIRYEAVLRHMAVPLGLENSNFRASLLKQIPTFPLGAGCLNTFAIIRASRSHGKKERSPLVLRRQVSSVLPIPTVRIPAHSFLSPF
jgi:hypothetical protein